MEYQLVYLLPQICDYSENGAIMGAVCKLWNLTRCEARWKTNISISRLCRNGDFALAMWIFPHGPTPRHLLDIIDYCWPYYSLIYGNLEALKFALLRGCKLPDKCLKIAATYGNWHIVEFLRSAGHNWRGDEFAEYIRKDPQGRLPLVPGLFARFFCTAQDFSAMGIAMLAGEIGSIELLQWICEQCVICPSLVCHVLNSAKTCSKSHHQFLDFIYADAGNKYPYDEIDIFSAAIYCDHTALVMAIFNETNAKCGGFSDSIKLRHICIEVLLNVAITNSNAEIVRLLLTADFVVNLERALLRALVKSDNVEIMQLLLTKNPDICKEYDRIYSHGAFIEQLLARGAIKIAEYLLWEYECGVIMPHDIILRIIALLWNRKTPLPTVDFIQRKFAPEIADVISGNRLLPHDTFDYRIYHIGKLRELRPHLFDL